jgi:DNA polymerase I-like protein with 3'-5' exonuclease and polymerase domains
MTSSHIDPGSVPIVFIDGSDSAELRAQLSCLAQAEAVALDTETVYDGNDEMECVTAGGERITYKRNLDVDGPGSWRVLSIAARLGPAGSQTIKAWTVDMRDADFATISDVLSGVTPYGWNANFDRAVLARDGVNIRFWWDVMLADAVVRSGSNGSDSSWYASLAKAAYRELKVNMDGKDTIRLSYDARTDLSPEQVRYAGMDAVITLILGDIILARAKSSNLMDTVERECAAAPLINQMTRQGLPIDRDAYVEQVLTPARLAAANAAEQLAILTTGKTLLTTVTRWAEHKGRVVSSDEVATGLSVLRDEAAFKEFLADTRAASLAARERVATCFGDGNAKEDLFSESTLPAPPFNVDDDNDIRRFLSKSIPLFASCVVTASLDSTLSLDDVVRQAAQDPEAVTAAAAGKKRLLKAHDLDSLVLPALTRAQLPSVDDRMRAGALALADYRRYRSIVQSYGEAQAPFKLLPDWKLSAASDVKNALNVFSTSQVKEHFKRTEGSSRLLTSSDSVDHDTLVLIGGPVCEELLTFRKNEKVVTTYGDEFLKFVHPVTGRIHAKYSQALTGTGRLSSSSPNAQNLPPSAKKFLRPSAVSGRVTRVLVAADLSQAELRYVADQSGDQTMLTAFLRGEDLHTRTASLMFNMDLVALKTFDATAITDVDATAVEGLIQFRERFCVGPLAKVDPSRSAASVYKELRQKAKRVAFGYAYGLKGASLANQLTVDGVHTSKEEADELLALFDEAYPAVAAWMGRRVDDVSQVSSSMMTGEADVDFDASWRLHGMFAKATAAVTALRAKLGYNPDDEQVSQFLVSDSDVDARAPKGVLGSEFRVSERARITAGVAWARSFDYPVVLSKDGTPWMFTSRTAGGRVRSFPILTRDWEWGMVQSIVRSRDTTVASCRDAWVAAYNADALAAANAERERGNLRKDPVPVHLYKKGSPSSPRPLFGKELEKQFEDRSRRTALVAHVFEALPHMTRKLMRAGAADRVRALTNQYRNHPVQGGVADAMLVAMARIDADLVSEFPSAFAIQSVHDSLVVECDVLHARRIRDLMVKHMQDGLNSFCPNVLALAEADIQLSLDDKTVLSDSDLDKLAA